jgi:phenylalanyl-tRNA synthetase alpha chain
MTEPLLDISALRNEALTALQPITTKDELEAWRITYLGRKGKVPQLLRQIKDLEPAQKRQLGQAGNELRRELEDTYRQQWENYQQGSAVSSPSAAKRAGHVHPLTLTTQRIQTILSDMGFTLVEGPLVEDPVYNFDKLNIPPEHPARAETDTFYLTTGQVLRTSTSPVQLRGVEQARRQPPFRLFSPGRVFRAEKVDATHSHTFHQFEGLVVEAEATVASFKSTIEQFYSRFFDKPATIRLRPHYFPFVEPGFEVDLECVFCEGKGCRICKHTGWIEMMGAGMVHPNVLRHMKIDPQQHRGFAFGGGFDRLTMLLLNVADLRQFWSGDVKFLSQF